MSGVEVTMTECLRKFDNSNLLFESCLCRAVSNPCPIGMELSARVLSRAPMVS